MAMIIGDPKDVVELMRLVNAGNVNEALKKTGLTPSSSESVEPDIVGKVIDVANRTQNVSLHTAGILVSPAVKKSTLTDATATATDLNRAIANDVITEGTNILLFEEEQERSGAVPYGMSMAHPDNIAKGQGYNPDFRSGAYKLTPGAYPTTATHPDNVAADDRVQGERSNPLNNPRYLEQLPPGNLGNLNPRINPAMYPGNDPLNPEDRNVTGGPLTNPNRVDAQHDAATLAGQAAADAEYSGLRGIFSRVRDAIVSAMSNIPSMVEKAQSYLQEKIQGKKQYIVLVGVALVGSFVLYGVYKLYKWFVNRDGQEVTAAKANMVDLPEELEESVYTFYAVGGSYESLSGITRKLNEGLFSGDDDGKQGLISKYISSAVDAAHVMFGDPGFKESKLRPYAEKGLANVAALYDEFLQDSAEL